MFRDATAYRACRGMRFWAPVFVFAAVVGGVGSFYFGQQANDAKRSAEDRAALAVKAISSPSYALEEAEREMRDGHIEFSVYRDLVGAALSRQDSEVRQAAYQSIHRVLASGRTSAERLKNWLPSLPTEVFIVTSDRNAADDIEQKLKRRDTTVVIQEPQNPSKQISKTQVFCYDQDVCRQAAPAVVDLLHEQGYEVDQAKFSDASSKSYINRIDIELPEAKKAELPDLKKGKPAAPAKKPVVKAAHRPNKAQPRLIAQE
ncbi:MAG: hypothetical protein JO288_04700 [Hyphomicrobiales bacterium]|nr:hypothetical protein [Hyphomicrobiales bacterium]